MGNDLIATKAISGPLASRYSGLCMTRFDLTTCKTILLRYKDILDNSPLDRDLSWMLWGGLIIRFTACFSSRQSRTKLNPDKVFPDKDGIRAMYKVIDDIRDKNIAHDVNWMNSDNAFTQIFSMAFLRPSSMCLCCIWKTK